MVVCRRKLDLVTSGIGHVDDSPCQSASGARVCVRVSAEFGRNDSVLDQRTATLDVHVQAQPARWKTISGFQCRNGPVNPAVSSDLQGGNT